MDPSITERVLDLAIQIQQIPVPTFEEGRRAEFIRKHFGGQVAIDVSVDECGNV